MIKIKRIVPLFLAVCLLVGCANSSGSGEVNHLPAAPTATPQTLEVYLQTESPAAETALQAYAEAQNVSISYASSPDHAGLAVLDALPDGDGYKDLTADTLLSAAAARITDDQTCAYALPLGKSQYGYWVDVNLLNALLGENAAADLQSCTWQEWYTFVESLGDWIAAPSSTTVTLNGNEYTLPKECPATLTGLDSVFALPTAQEAMTGAAYTAVLLAAGDAPTEKTLTGPLYGIASAFMLEFDHCSNATTKEGAIAQLAVGSSLFYRGTLVDLTGKLGAEKCSRFLPVPFKGYWEESDLSTDAYTVENLLTEMTQTDTVYLAIPAAADDSAAKDGAAAILWLYTAEGGEQVLTQDLLLTTPWGSQPQTGELAERLTEQENKGLLPAPQMGDTVRTALTEAANDLRGDKPDANAFLDEVIPLLCDEEETQEEAQK